MSLTLNPSGSAPLAPYASLTSTRAPSAIYSRALRPLVLALSAVFLGLPDNLRSALAITRFFVVIAGDAGTAVIDSRVLERVRLAGESNTDGGWFSLSY
jgi:hypothetical protein